MFFVFEQMATKCETIKILTLGRGTLHRITVVPAFFFLTRYILDLFINNLFYNKNYIYIYILEYIILSYKK